MLNDGLSILLILRSCGGPSRVGDDFAAVPGDRLADEQVERIEVRGAEPELQRAGPGGGEGGQQTAGHHKQTRLEIFTIYWKHSEISSCSHIALMDHQEDNFQLLRF